MKKFGMLIGGIIFLAAAIFMFLQDKRLVQECTEETTAKVVEMEEELSTDSDGFTSYTYYPVVEYTVNNETQKEKMRTGSSNPNYKIGEQVTILYNPNKPSEFIVKGEKSLSIFSIVFAVIGLGLAGYGAKVAFSKE